jgi:hypothetical protein
MRLNYFKLRFKQHFLGIGILFFLLCVFYWNILSGKNVFVMMDSSRFFFPLWKWGSSIFKNGKIPLWNPFAGLGGSPYLADPQMAIANPIVFIFLKCFKTSTAFSWILLFGYFWGMLGFYLLMSSKKFSFQACLIGTIIFIFSLNLISMVSVPIAVLSVSWIPWIFWAMDQIVLQKKSGLLFFSLSLAFQMASGYPVFCYLTTLALGLELILEHGITVKFLREIFPGLVMGVIIAAFYNAVWGIPFLEFLKQTNYSQGVHFYDNLKFSDLKTFFSPFCFGNPKKGIYNGEFWVRNFFIGLPPLILILWASIQKKFHYKLSALAGIFILFSLSGSLGIALILRKSLPGFSWIVHSGFFIPLIVFYLARSVVQIIPSFLTMTQYWEKVTFLFLSVIIFGISFFWNHFDLGIYHPFFHFGVFFWMSLGCVFLSVIWEKMRYIFLLSAILLSLWPAAWNIKTEMKSSYYKIQPKILTALNKKKGAIFYSPYTLEKMRWVYGKNWKSIYQMTKQEIYLNWPIAFKRKCIPFYNTLQLKRAEDWYETFFHYSFFLTQQALNFMNVQYAVGNIHLPEFVDLKIPLDHYKIFENKNFISSWISIREARLEMPSLQMDFRRISKQHWNLFKICTVSSIQDKGFFYPRLIFKKRISPQKIQINALGTHKALLVTPVIFYPGWRFQTAHNCYVKPILIDHLYCGIALNSNIQKILLVYKPRTFRVGLFFCLIACLVWGGMGVWILLQKK